MFGVCGSGYRVSGGGGFGSGVWGFQGFGLRVMKGLGFRVPFPDTERSVNRLAYGLGVCGSVFRPFGRRIYIYIYIYTYMHMYTYTKSQNGSGSKTWQ